MNSWNNCRNILCIRPDNMGDVIMTGPALRALKETFGCRITLLTSTMGSVVASSMKEIDNTIVCNLPWVKITGAINNLECMELCEELRRYAFDAAVIFTVFSQNPLPAALLVYMAGIPRCLSYCRENPYQLLSHWVPDPEPYGFVRHQVQRDLDLVSAVGAATQHKQLALQVKDHAWQSARSKMETNGINTQQQWIVLHPGVSDAKREYPLDLWMETARLVHKKTGIAMLITGAAAETAIALQIQEAAPESAVSLAGQLSVEEFIAVINRATLAVSVNTATVHIAAATKTPVIVLYALTNPQHTPWMAPSRVMPFSVKEELKSRNEIIRFVDHVFFTTTLPYPAPADIAQAAAEMVGATNHKKTAGLPATPPILFKNAHWHGKQH